MHNNLLSSSDGDAVSVALDEEEVLARPGKARKVGKEGEKKGLPSAVEMITHLKRIGQQGAEYLCEKVCKLQLQNGIKQCRKENKKETN